MTSIYKDTKEREISKLEDVVFGIESTGIYLIDISARAKNEKQLGGTDDEDLRIEIDKKKFPQLKNSQRYFDSPASFSGGTSKGLKKTIYFKWLYDRYAEDPEHLEKTLAAWNWGLNRFPKEGPLDYSSMPDETKNFIRFILNK